MAKGHTVLGILVLACGSALYAFRYVTRPTTLTVAASSADGAVVQLMSAIATRLASTGASVRLQVLDKGNALDAVKAFSAAGRQIWRWPAPILAIYQALRRL